ncbi:reverse transcriptase domain-containing protein [Tanacetum coccineum]
MRTRSSSNLVGNSSSNPTTSNPKRRNRRRSNKRVEPFALEESPIVTMADQRTMAELLRTPTEGYAEAIMVPPILAEHFEYKDLLRACPYHGFIELHQLDTFYNALNPADQDSLNSAAGGNLLERRTQDVLRIIENKSKVLNSRSKPIVSQVKSSDVNSSSSSDIAKLTHAAVEEIYVTCGGAHPYYQCLAADGNTFLEYQDNIQGYIAVAAGNYNQGNSGYRPPGVANQTRQPGFAQQNGHNNENRFSQPQGYNRGNNFNQNANYQAPTQQNQSVPLSELEKIKKMNDILPSNTVANPKGELKPITTRSGLVLDGPTVPMPPPFINLEEDERVEETLTDPEYAVILKKLPEKLGDPGKFLIPCGFSELKCKALADLGIARDVFVSVGKFTFPADFVIINYESDPRVPLILGRPFLRTARALIDVHGEEMILRDGNERLILNMRNDTSSYSNEPHQESINMIDVYNVSHEEILKDLFATNHPSGNPTSSLTSHTNLTLSEVNDDIFDPEEDIIKNLLNLDKTKDLPPYHDNPLSGNPTPISEPKTKSSSSSPTLISIEKSDLIWEAFEAFLANDSFPSGNSNPLSPLPHFHNNLSGSTTSSSPSLPISETSDYFLEEFADELTLITFPLGNDDLSFDAESDL